MTGKALKDSASFFTNFLKLPKWVHYFLVLVLIGLFFQLPVLFVYSSTTENLNYQHVSPIQLISRHLEPIINKQPNNPKINPHLILLKNKSINENTRIYPPPAKPTILSQMTSQIVNVLNDKKMNSNKNNILFDKLVSNTSLPIYGNPFNYNKCLNALIKQENININLLSAEYYKWLNDNNYSPNKVHHLPPLIWTRESISAMLDNKEHYYGIYGQLYSNWDTNKEVRSGVLISQDSKTAYFQVVKCGSSSTVHYLKHMNNKFSRHFSPKSYRINYRDSMRSLNISNATCIFTFTRDPIHRLISAYYTINFWMWKQMMRYDEGDYFRAGKFINITNTYKFWNVIGEPNRFMAFVNDLIKYTNKFIEWHPLQHVVTQIGNLSPFYGSNINFIGRVEYYDKHWQLLSEDSKCSKDIIYNKSDGDYVWHDLHGEGTHPDSPKYPLAEGYVKALSLDSYKWPRDSKYNLPAWKAIKNNQTFLNKIVEHYYQDYICFGYKPNYVKQIGRKYTGNYQF